MTLEMKVKVGSSKENLRTLFKFKKSKKVANTKRFVVLPFVYYYLFFKLRQRKVKTNMVFKEHFL